MSENERYSSPTEIDPPKPREMNLLRIPTFRPRGATVRDDEEEEEEDLSRRGETVRWMHPSMALRFALLLSSGHIFYLCCADTTLVPPSFSIFLLLPSNRSPTSLSLSLSLSTRSSARAMRLSLSLFHCLFVSICDSSSCSISRSVSIVSIIRICGETRR